MLCVLRAAYCDCAVCCAVLGAVCYVLCVLLLSIGLIIPERIGELNAAKTERTQILDPLCCCHIIQVDLRLNRLLGVRHCYLQRYDRGKKDTHSNLDTSSRQEPACRVTSTSVSIIYHTTEIEVLRCSSADRVINLYSASAE